MSGKRKTQARVNKMAHKFHIEMLSLLKFKTMRIPRKIKKRFKLDIGILQSDKSLKIVRAQTKKRGKEFTVRLRKSKR
jgi:hypothetical protein